MFLIYIININLFLYFIQGYENVLKLIRETGTGDFNRVDMEGVMGLLDKSIQGNVIKELPKFKEENRNLVKEAAQNQKATQEAQLAQKKSMMQDEVKNITSNYVNHECNKLVFLYHISFRNKCLNNSNV